MKHLGYIFITLFYLHSVTVTAQSHELTGFIGISSYEGDVNKRDLFLLQEAHLAISLQYKKYVTKNIYASLHFGYGNISGTDENFEDRSQWPRVLSFDSPITELGFQAEWLLNGVDVLYVYDVEGNQYKWDQYPEGMTIYTKDGLKLKREKDFFTYSDLDGNLVVMDSAQNVTVYGTYWDILEERYPKRFTPYILSGIGVSFFNPNPQGLIEGDDPETLPGVYGNRHITMPIGGGFRYDFGPKHAISAEAAYRYPFTDYIDGISDSRDPDDNDWYIFLGLRYSYKMGFNKSYLHEDEEILENLGY